jgi:ketosteroid isomerase-like protein
VRKVAFPHRVSTFIVILVVATAAAAAESPEDAIRRIDTSWGDAFQACDLKRMDDILSDQLVFIVQNGTVQDKREQMTSVGRCDMKQMAVRPEKIRVFGNTGIVHGTLEYRLEGPRGKSGGVLVYSRVYTKQGGTWRMVQHQSTARASAPPAGRAGAPLMAPRPSISELSWSTSMKRRGATTMSSGWRCHQRARSDRTPGRKIPPVR